MNIKTRDLYMLKRKKKKITLVEIAKKIGVSQPSLSLYENGKMNLTKENLEAYKAYIDNKEV
jgi:transcriptional regulator with XRE-family HTH domain